MSRWRDEWRCTQQANADIRAQAVIYWGEIYRAQRQTLPQPVTETMTTIAVNDTAFNPRFPARKFLREMGVPVPFDNPPCVYVCKVKL